MKQYIKFVTLIVLAVLSLQVQANSKVSKEAKQDLVGLFQFFEDRCGYDDDFNSKDSASKKQLQLFKNSFIGYSDDYYVKPLSNLPPKYRKNVKDITLVEDDREVMHYIVSFKNATYRGYDIDKLDISFIPGSEYDYYDHLYYKDASFLKLKPEFKFAAENSGWTQDGSIQGFNREKLSITCEGMEI